jgi:hypothetical protein
MFVALMETRMSFPIWMMISGVLFFSFVIGLATTIEFFEKRATKKGRRNIGPKLK